MGAPLKLSYVVVAGGETCRSRRSRLAATTTLALAVLYADVLSAIEVKTSLIRAYLFRRSFHGQLVPCGYARSWAFEEASFLKV